MRRVLGWGLGPAHLPQRVRCAPAAGPGVLRSCWATGVSGPGGRGWVALHAVTCFRVAEVCRRGLLTVEPSLLRQLPAPAQGWQKRALALACEVGLLVPFLDWTASWPQWRPCPCDRLSRPGPPGLPSPHGASG